jgi:hypothetical protein
MHSTNKNGEEFLPPRDIDDRQIYWRIVAIPEQVLTAVPIAAACTA